MISVEDYKNYIKRIKSQPKDSSFCMACKTIIYAEQTRYGIAVQFKEYVSAPDKRVIDFHELCFKVIAGDWYMFEKIDPDDVPF